MPMFETRFRAWAAFVVAPFLASLGACGGGGSDPVAAAILNLAPTFSSATQVSVAENTSGTLYTVTATDPDGDALTISVLPGGDEALFTIDTAAGTVSATTPLDFEAPSDANADNQYDLTFEVRDPSGLAAQLAVVINVTNVVEGMALRRVGSGFSRPLYLAALPGTNDVVIAEQRGRIRLLNPDTGAIDAVDFLDVTTELSTGPEQGLLGLAFSPDFATDRTVYINLTNTAGDTEIRRYQMFSGSDRQVDPFTADVILRVAQPDLNHNGGWIGFDAAGLLYVPIGDGGGGGDPSGFAQNTSSLLGKILRLDVSGDAFPSDPDRDYQIPPGNAFAASAGAEEIFAYGLRNPFRASFDSVTGDLFIGDVGQGAVEEIDRLRPGDAGTNFGWNIQEGTQDFGGADRADLTDPVAEYLRGSGPTEGRSVTGGYVYRGNIEPIKDHYVFGDFISANVWAVPVDDLVIGQTVAASQFTRLNPSLVPDAGSLIQISSFGEDASGALYIVSLGGDVFRIESDP